MEVIGRKVIHKKFGEGVITCIEAGRVTLAFKDKERLFACVDPFINALEGDREVIDYFISCMDAEKRAKSRKPEIDKKQVREVYVEQEEKSELYNVAVDAVFCDGGAGDLRVGFSGICSDALLEENVNASDERWCTKNECRCGIYLRDKSTALRRELDRLLEDGGYVCEECRLLRDWAVSLGVYNNRQPRRLPTGTDKLCILTTVEPGMEEKDRYIFALYIIEDTYEDINGVDQLMANARLKYAFPPELAQKMNFWAFFSDMEALWGKDKFRLMDDSGAAAILLRAADLTGEPVFKSMLACVMGDY